MALTTNKMVLDFVEEMKTLANPDHVVWIDGSKEQLDTLKEEACATGELIKLDQEKLPGCYYHRSAIDDVARVEDRTYICCNQEVDAGPNNNWMAPEDAYAMAKDIFKNSMVGRTMYVIPFSMGPIGSPFAKAGVELTDSIYVVLNMDIMTRIGARVFEMLGDSNDFVRGMHSKCELDARRRYILHFPEDNAIWSMNSGYGGNVLLGKKCFALRMASYQGKNEGWLAEHMLILGIENPQGEVSYIAGAFPSACGKTNLAMLIPPELYKKKGYKVWTVGDDIAWLRVGEDGRLWAINPENGFFGVAPGTNMKSNPNAVASTMKDTIFTNVVLTKDNTVWWEGLDNNPPHGALDWKGNPWDPASGESGAHPNSRFTSPAKNCPCIASNWEDPKGVPISAIIFGGRRAKVAPLVYQSRDWQHGVFVGSIMASETTAAATGATGVLRHDPFAMLPFCGYNMADYWQHWLDIGKRLTNPPLIFNVNWFRLDDSGNFIWPGYGENFRVLEWIIRRCKGEVDARETAVGYTPRSRDIDIDEIDYYIHPGLRFNVEALRAILSVGSVYWKEILAPVKAFYAQFGDHLPQELADELTALESRLWLV
ncbi:MAG: phosphoenolpyruvate carboxykinase (GTP) [Oscillospiraceae bacterium]|nr:phosphoenolpyruvate carboxykinase (GTP) [Oscillospiraceae bacterium]